LAWSATRGTSKPRASKTAREGVDQFNRVGVDRSGSGKIFQIGQERRFGLFHQLSYLRMISSALGHRARNQVIVPGFIIIPGGHHVARSEFSERDLNFSEIHAAMLESVPFGWPHQSSPPHDCYQFIVQLLATCNTMSAI